MYRLVPFREELAHFLFYAGSDWWGLLRVPLFFLLPVAVFLFGFFSIMFSFLFVEDSWGDYQKPRQPKVSPPFVFGLLENIFVSVLTFLFFTALSLYLGLTYVGVMDSYFDIDNDRKADRLKLEISVEEATTDQELADLLSSGVPSVEELIAAHEAMGPETQKYLALNGDESVRVAIARTAEYIWPGTFAILEQDESDEVRLWMVSRTDVPLAFLVEALEDDNHNIAVAAFRNTMTPRSSKCAIVQAILEGSEHYDHFLEETGRMVDYCASVEKASHQRTP